VRRRNGEWGATHGALPRLRGRGKQRDSLLPPLLFPRSVLCHPVRDPHCASRSRHGSPGLLDDRAQHGAEKLYNAMSLLTTASQARQRSKGGDPFHPIRQYAEDRHARNLAIGYRLLAICGTRYALAADNFSISS
jgi:hypothetical protein